MKLTMALKPNTLMQKNSTGPAFAEVPAGRLKFAACGEFQYELRRRVESYFSSTGQRPRDCPRMYLKAGVVLGWFVASYVLLVFFAATWWQALPLAVSMGLSIAAVGFNIHHDGGHGSFSYRPWVNKLMALTMDLTGASSYLWARKHNVIHHSYANITGHDDDINVGLLGRLSPHQKRLPLHRWQHYYLWALYGLLPLKWLFFDDFWNIFTGRIGEHRIARPRRWDLLTFVAGKTVAFLLTFGLPLLFHPLWVVLLFYGVTSIVLGVTLSVVFQMAHCVEEASFPMPRADTGRIESAWAVHQVQTTVDFARGNRLLTWLIGGLNFQIEHHLFPQICHVHYPALARVVEQTCNEFGVRYVAQKSFLAGIVSHFRWLRRMGMAVATQ
jgi:linoleoyl-CoA desaturase